MYVVRVAELQAREYRAESEMEAIQKAMALSDEDISLAVCVYATDDERYDAERPDWVVFAGQWYRPDTLMTDTAQYAAGMPRREGEK